MPRRERSSKKRTGPALSKWVETADGIPWPPLTQVGVHRGGLRIALWCDSVGRQVVPIYGDPFDEDSRRWKLVPTSDADREANLVAVRQHRQRFPKYEGIHE